MKNKKAFTLIELLIASSILMMVITMSMRIFFNVTRLNTYIDLTSVLQSESKYLMERIVREVKNNTLDYPEYYNFYVLNDIGDDWNLGSNYSAYAKRFYNPGMSADSPTVQGANRAGIIEDDLGAWCQWRYIPRAVAPVGSTKCNGVPTLEATEDFATGTNPYTGAIFTLPNQASAICDSTSEMFTFSQRQCSFTNPTDAHVVDKLFLISPDGITKTIIAREPWSDPAYGSGDVVSMMQLTGTDTNNDGVKNSWECADRFLCFLLSSLPDLMDLTNSNKQIENLFTEFAPISPYNLNITDLRFYIAPIEDPHKAYDEYMQKIQPYVTIVMTAEINDPRISQLPVSQRSITLQTTVSSGVYNEIPSYSGE